MEYYQNNDKLIQNNQQSFPLNDTTNQNPRYSSLNKTFHQNMGYNQSLNYNNQSINYDNQSINYNNQNINNNSYTINMNINLTNVVPDYLKTQ